MTTLEDIVNPLPAVLLASKSLFEKAGHTVYSVSAFDEGPDDSKKSPYLEIQIQNLRASGQEYPLDGGGSVWSSWDGTLIVRAATMRGKNGDKHNAMVGGVYVIVARLPRRRLFTPVHYVQHFRPSGLQSSTDGLLDYSEISFDVQIFVRDDAWADQGSR